VKIVAFLQNQWFNDPEGVKAMLNRQREVGEYTQEQMRARVRRRLIHYALFAGCLTGRRLKRAFGELTSSIIWEEGSREIGGKSSAFFPPDEAHIRAVIEEEKPDFILCFGASNRPVIEKLYPWPTSAIQVFFMPHPAARHATVAQELADGEMALQIAMQERSAMTPSCFKREGM
jgi:hypothetical protein